MNTLAERLREALDEMNGATQADLARACGIRAPSVHDWFSGKTKSLRGTTLIKAAEFLRVRPVWLAEGKGSKRAGEKTGFDDTHVSEPSPPWPLPGISEEAIRALSSHDRARIEGAIRSALTCLERQADADEQELRLAVVSTGASEWPFRRLPVSRLQRLTPNQILGIEDSMIQQVDSFLGGEEKSSGDAGAA